MSQKQINRNQRRAKIKKRIRKKITGTTQKPRLSVFRSLKSISAQLIDDSDNKTLLTVTSLSKSLKEKSAEAKSKTEIANLVGKTVAEEAEKLNIKEVVFDRNGYLYHGRVKAVADGAREAGLKF